MKYEIAPNEALSARFFLGLAATGHGSTGLTVGSFIEVVRRPDNTIKALTGKTYAEQEDGYYGLTTLANFFDVEGEWEIHINPNDAGVTFGGVVYIHVCSDDAKIREL